MDALLYAPFGVFFRCRVCRELLVDFVGAAFGAINRGVKKHDVDITCVGREIFSITIRAWVIIVVQKLTKVINIILTVVETLIQEKNVNYSP